MCDHAVPTIPPALRRDPGAGDAHQKAAQLWDERIGAARVQARNWRPMAFGGLSLSLGLAGGLIWQSAQSRVVPYVVEIDTQGQVRAVGPAIEAYRPSDAQIAWYLARFITNVRALSIDPVLVRQNWLEAYDFVTDRAALFLTEQACASDPFAQIGTRTVSVQVTSVVRASESSFQVKWTEQLYERGSLAATSRWTAILSIVIQPPRTAETVRKNPLGLYVTALAWTRDLDPGASKPEGKSP
ncbi:conjugal transfer protein TrbF [Magnetospirillum molischianum]|uniref:Conjugal transfer protein TrbF n=1 Tax=Magnetospirillum molischianum DSM 120 TaxID=1150626 RepID=H8FWM1_MAGML|nr:Conjugal transfer protein; TrbF [Magnetospirillum molischianum DSM 120]